MQTNKNVVAEFKDRFGDVRVIHKNRNGLAVKREKQTVSLRLNSVIASMVGARVRMLREQRGYTLEQLCLRAGLASQTPKSRMWEIENGVRKEGVRFGTLYALAIALDVEPVALLPSREEVLEVAPIQMTSEPALTASTIPMAS